MFQITRYVEGESAALELHGVSLRLFVRQIIEVRDDGHCHTESYGYRLQESEARDSWRVRWEFFDKEPLPDYPYPLAHVHVRATLPDGDSVERLHFPTSRVPLELVIWHLIAEWGVRSKTDEWQEVLRESMKGFGERRTDIGLR